MADENKRKLRVATIVYCILLLYIIAALAWWALSLVKQSETIHDQRKQALVERVSDQSSPQFKSELHDIDEQRTMSFYKYAGEGSTFLLLILVGAVFVYRSVRRQFKVQQQQQNFVMAVTHELKTPIAVSRLNLETLQKYQLEEAKKQKLLQMTLQENMRLDSLINNILISFQLEDRSYHLTKEEINLSDLVKNIVAQFCSRYPARVTKPEIEEDIDFMGDPVLMKLLVSNLLENAHKYSSSEKSIILQLQRNAGIELIVADEGKGVPDNEKKNIFKKFYRIGTEQTRKTKGTGLGLYLCKKIVQDHNGEIFVKDNYPTGSKFIVQFPS